MSAQIMDADSVRKEMARILKDLAADKALSRFVDASLPCPEPYRGTVPIQLIFLGQDPTVKNARSRKGIRTVLNLDRRGPLRDYVNHIARGLGFSADRIYATNLVKNFFKIPPSQEHDPHNLLASCAQKWRGLLQQEIAAFPGTPIITFGEPVLKVIVKGDAPSQVREYWGYQGSGKSANTAAFRVLAPSENTLGHTVLPFPHLTSLSRAFYRRSISNYLTFARLKNISLAT